MPFKRKHHEIIQDIEHKHCGKCDKWKILEKFTKRKKTWDGKRNYCKACANKIKNERNKKVLEKRQMACQDAPTGFSVCLNVYCTIKELLQPEDQFINTKLHTHTFTRICFTCRRRNIEKTYQSGTIREACLAVWDEWRKNNKCIKCSKDPIHKHNYLLIEADHLPEFEKVKECSNMSYWKVKSRGVLALKAELKKCQALCRFHHKLQTQQRNHDNGYILKQVYKLRKRAIINAEKHKRGCCSNPKCKRHVKEGEECGFDFDHRDPTTKFIRNGKPIGPSAFVMLPQALFDTQWPLEKELVDLLCTNCHKLKTFANRDSYKK